ncbi:MAG: hypothetical protein R3F11_13035 [Verrucomicrobiales bacterium]
MKLDANARPGDTLEIANGIADVNGDQPPTVSFTLPEPLQPSVTSFHLPAARI